MTDDILRDTLADRDRELAALREENQALREAAKDICDKWVHPKMYAQAMAELENLPVRYTRVISSEVVGGFCWRPAAINAPSSSKAIPRAKWRCRVWPWTGKPARFFWRGGSGDKR